MAGAVEPRTGETTAILWKVNRLVPLPESDDQPKLVEERLGYPYAATQSRSNTELQGCGAGAYSCRDSATAEVQSSDASRWAPMRSSSHRRKAATSHRLLQSQMIRSD